MAILFQGGFAQAAQPAAEDFFRNPSITDVRLSPDGRYVAMLVALKTGRVQLAVTEIGVGQPKIIAGFNDADLSNIGWVSNDRLVMNVTDLRTAAGDNYLGAGLFAINRDGSLPKNIVPRSQIANIGTGSLTWNHRLHSLDPVHFPDEVYLVEFEKRAPHLPERLLRVDTRTARFEAVGRFGPNARSWVIAKDGVPRITTTQDKGVTTIYYNDPATRDWRQIAQFETYSQQGFTPDAFGPDGTLYVTSAIAGDKKAIHIFDLVNNRVNPQPVAALQNYDLGGGFVQGPDGIVGVRYLAKTYGTYWFDPNWKQVQQDVNALLPTTSNSLLIAQDPASPNVVVLSGSDVQPPVFFLYDKQNKKLTLLGKSMPSIDPEQMGETEMLRYPARDGLEIPAWLTLPNGGSGKNLPLVVLVHGGPYLRGGNWTWNAERQFLASRGYAVLEPEFRGSTGFGAKHFLAGWKQWGLKMQDDIADGTRLLIAKGIADPKRICIAGASYGGYATLMGLINDPDLFKCGVEWVGVTDIDLMYTLTTSDFTNEWKQYGIPKLVGDQERDAEQLKKTSPLAQAARITQPLLMAYGESDKRVPIIHGTTLRDALRNHNSQVEWVSYPKEGHGWKLVSNRIDFWNRVEAFLDRNIGTGQATTTAQAKPQH